MSKARLLFPMVTLQDGRALALGNGYNVCSGECSGFPGPDQSARFADLYDPSSNTWTATTGLNLDRSAYSTVLLKDGRVLVSGGYADPPSVCFSSAKLFDPAKNAWTQTKSLMKDDRCDPAGALMADGKVLLAGGVNYKGKALSSAEVFDSSNQSWAFVAAMPGVRIGGQAVALGNGEILVAGGTDGNQNDLASSWLYDPAANKWSTAGSLSQAPKQGRLIALADGSALMVGDGYYSGGSWHKAPSERFDPNTSTWTKIADMTTSRHQAFVVLMSDGKVMVAGGSIKVGSGKSGRITTLTKTVEIWDPGTNTWTATVDMPNVREAGAATLLQDGSVLLAGGDLGEQGELAIPGGYPIKVLATAVRYIP